MRTHSLKVALPAAALAALVLFALGISEDLWHLPQPGRAPSTSTQTATVIRIIDGDTLDATLEGSSRAQRVRILGINAPEVAHAPGEADQCGGRAATDHLKALAPPGTTILLTADSRSDDTDRYARRLRYVDTPQGSDIGAQLIINGYAYAWKPASAPNPDRWGDYRASTRAAQAARAGSWKECPRLDKSR